MQRVRFLAVLVLAFTVLAGCVGHANDAVTQQSAGSTDAGGSTPAATGLVAPTALPDIPFKVATDAAAWIAPGTSVAASVALPPEAAAPIAYTWLWGPMGGMAPITVMKQTQTDLIAPGASARITFDQAGIFTEHCHPHPWMLSTVVVLDNGQAPQTVTVHFVDGETKENFKFVPDIVVISKGSTVVYENDGKQAHQTMLMKQDAPLAVQSAKDAQATISATGSGWMRAVVVAQDAKGYVGMAESDVYVAPIPAPLTQTFGGQFNVTLPAQAPAQPPAPVGSAGDTFPFSASGAGRFWINFTSQDGVAANAPTDPAGDTSQIQVQVAAKDGSYKEASAPSDKGGLTNVVKAGDYAITVSPAAGQDVTYTVTLTLVYDLVPPKANPYADPTTQVTMGSSAPAGM
ncbi:MAG: hypothetical protein QOE90_93 [Thermoplasmata archaeon]|jgi:plastocyanin|nr:hypothetical protein [Thermoplasmata archaeon]